MFAGCITCKKKRLKCDETKPTCVQCEKRSVECEGYKKDYKWRTFEETTRNSKAAKARKTSTFTLDSTLETQRESQSSSRSPIAANDQYPKWSPHLQNAFTTAAQAFSGPSPPPELTAALDSSGELDSVHSEQLPSLNTGFNSEELHLSSPLHHDNNGNHAQQHARTTTMQQSSVSHTSPNLADLLLPGTNMREPPDSSELRPPMSPHPYGSDFVESTINSNAFEANEEDFDEEIVRQPEVPIHKMSNSQWQFMGATSPFSVASTASSRPTDMSIIRPPQLNPSSPEMLLLRFDKQTCGILSVKDGPTENPWRTLVWPFAKTSPALYHAISSMAALHGSLSDPKLRISGMAHMNKSMKELCGSLHQMGSDQALATSLALTLGEGWDERISTGIEHLKGAKALVRRMLADWKSLARVRQASNEEVKRVRFLCNTYVYLAVIARLTSSGEHESEDFDGILQSVNTLFDGEYVEIDPLMGCATTLFPIIGKVATLIQRARNMSRNSLHLVSEADALREQLLNWQPPNVNFIEQPEDPSSEARHAVQTALSYRLASLLYLHQAVPELPCESAHKLAKDILTVLAAVPLHSRMLIVQIFPLLMGSCEMVSPEDRHWVTQRWESMLQRLSIVNVKSCWKLVQEIWKRRDAYTCERAQELAAKSFSSINSQSLPIPAVLKRKMLVEDPFDEGALLELHGQSLGLPQFRDPRPLKRRFTLDPSTENGVDEISSRYLVPIPRRHTDVTISSIAPEYTIRGKLHWLKVMTEWEWEGKNSEFPT